MSEKSHKAGAKESYPGYTYKCTVGTRTRADRVNKPQVEGRATLAAFHLSFRKKEEMNADEPRPSIVSKNQKKKAKRLKEKARRKAEKARLRAEREVAEQKRRKQKKTSASLKSWPVARAPVIYVLRHRRKDESDTLDAISFWTLAVCEATARALRLRT